MTLAAQRKPDEPAKYECPPPLALRFQLGDYHLIRAGGIWDQPVGEWKAQQYAGWIWSILEAEREATEAWPLNERLKPNELKMLWETIKPIQLELAKENNG